VDSRYVLWFFSSNVHITFPIINCNIDTENQTLSACLWHLPLILSVAVSDVIDDYFHKVTPVQKTRTQQSVYGFGHSKKSALLVAISHGLTDRMGAN